MKNILPLIVAALLLFSVTSLQAAPIVYEGTEGPGVGKHIVFIASDHEYRSEETLPALARILAKHHGFKCTVVFGVDEDGVIKPGHSNVPGIEALKTADLMVIFTRFQDWPADQMNHFLDYIKRGGPVVGLRTATHGFKIPADSPFAKYGDKYRGDDYYGGFGRQILGENWVGHYGKNHQLSTRLDIVKENAKHPIMRGVKDVWIQCGAYFADPAKPNITLVMAQPILGMTPDAPDSPEHTPVPGAWTREYKSESGKTGRVFTTTYGASNDIENDGFRRMVLNGCFWAAGLEKAIKRKNNIDFVGPFNATWRKERGKRKGGTKPEDLAGWASPIVPLEGE
jgi:hypothetical protein